MPPANLTLFWDRAQGPSDRCRWTDLLDLLASLGPPRGGGTQRNQRAGGDVSRSETTYGRARRTRRRHRWPGMVKDLVVPEDVLVAIEAFPHVRRAWETCSVEHKEAWLRYIEEAESQAHRERRVDIMIAGLRP